MNKKKVMFIIPHLGSGGAERKVDQNKGDCSTHSTMS
jgi:hypothetical protein